MNNFKEKANFLWSIADLLRGHYKQADYGKVILPLTVLRRLDFVLAPTKKKVLEMYEANKKKKPEILEPLLNSTARAKFHNRSKFHFSELAKDPAHIAANLRNYINGFSIGAKEIIDYFSFDDQIKKLDEYDLLYLVIKRFDEAGDMFNEVDTMEMGYVFEELIRKFAELSNETAGEHFTPREVIRLMVNLLFVNDKDILRKKGIVKTLYDPACGTGGMLSVAEEYLHELNPDAKLEVFGQEINPESYAICKSDMLIKGQNPANIKFGNSLGKNWERKKLKYLTNIISKGTTPSTVNAEIISDGPIRFLKAENILSMNTVSELPANFIDSDTNKLLKRSELRDQDVLIVIAGATIGKVAVLSEDFLPANTNQAVCFIRLKDKNLSNWVWLYLQSDVIKESIWIDAVQSAQPNLSMEKIGNLIISLPSTKELPQIEKFIQRELLRVDESIKNIEKEISLMQEYKTALISEVVTGKVKVI